MPINSGSPKPILRNSRKPAFSVKPFTTQVDAFKCLAESHHQNYLVNHPTEPYIVTNDLPKIVNLKRLFPDLYRDDPVLTTALAPA